MKKIIFIVCIASLTIFSCAPGANDPLENQLQAYNWKITYMWYQGQDKSDAFTHYIFDFVNATSVTAMKPDSSFNGSWNRSNDSQDNPKIILNFGTHYQLKMLNYEWHQEERSNDRIMLLAPVDNNKVTFERLP